MGGKRTGEASRIAKKAKAEVVAGLAPEGRGVASAASRIAVRPSSGPPAPKKKRGGFASMSPERLREVSKKGGDRAAEALGKNRGFALLPEEERRAIARAGQREVRARGTAYKFDEEAARAARAVGKRFSSLPENWRAAARVARGFAKLAGILQVDVSTLYKIARGLYEPRKNLQILINEWFDKRHIPLPFPEMADETRRYATA